MEPLATQYLGQSPADLALAATLLGQGGLVAIPTETVYGLAADATNDAAVAAIYAAKGRPSFNPLIIHVSDIEMAETYARFSPGLLLQLENLSLLERGDIEWADSCAAPGHSMIERIWREKRRITTRNVAIGGAIRRAAFRALMAYEMRGKDAP